MEAATLEIRANGPDNEEGIGESNGMGLITGSGLSPRSRWHPDGQIPAGLAVDTA